MVRRPVRSTSPVGEHDLQAEHEVSGDAVLHAAHAAGIGGDVAADAGDVDTARVGRVQQAVLGDRRTDCGGDHAGLDDGDTVDGVDVDDACRGVGCSARQHRLAGSLPR